MSTYNIPHDQAAELAAIGAAVQGKYNDLAAFGINSDHFHHFKCRIMWEEMVAMDREGVPIGVETLCHRFVGADKINSPTIVDVNHAVDACPTTISWLYWAEMVESKRKARVIQEAGLKLAQTSGECDNLDDLVATAETVIYSLNQSITTATGDRKESFQRVIGMLEEAHSGKKVGIPTGFPSIDRILGGMRGGQLLVLAARPSVGKSAIAGNIAENLVLQDVPVGFFSYEMTQDELNMRMLSSVSDTNLTGDILNQNADEQGRLATMAKASSRVVDLCKAPIHIIDNPSLTVNQIRAHARRLVKDYGVKLLIIDYIQLIKPGVDEGRKDRHLQIAAITGGLKQLAMELNIPSLGLAQLSREAEKFAGKRPTMSMLRESGSIEQDADVVMFLYCADTSMFEGPNTLLNVAVGKNRSGRLGDTELVLVRNKTRFEEATEPHHEEWLNRRRAEQVEREGR